MLEWIYNIGPEKDPPEDYVLWGGPEDISFYQRHFTKGMREFSGASPLHAKRDRKGGHRAKLINLYGDEGF